MPAAGREFTRLLGLSCDDAELGLVVVIEQKAALILGDRPLQAGGDRHPQLEPGVYLIGSARRPRQHVDEAQAESFERLWAMHRAKDIEHTNDTAPEVVKHRVALGAVEE